MDDATRPADATPRRLVRQPSWLTSEVAKRAHRLVSDALAQDGYRKHHYAVLAALDEYGAASQAELGRRLWMDRSDLHAIVGELERDNLIARVRDQQDRRRNVVELTPAGAAMLARLDDRVQAAQKALLAPLSAADGEHLRELLQRLIDHHATQP